MTEPTFSLIFVNYRSAAQLATAMVSWQRAFAAVPVEFIVMNNDRQEVDVLQQLSQTYDFVLHHLEENIGFGGACNRGAKLAQGKFLFFLNPDTEYVRGSVRALLGILEHRPRSVGGMRLIDALDRDEHWSCGRFPNLWRILDKRIFGFPSRPFWKRQEFSFPQWVSGAALLVRRDFFVVLGGFDSQFFLYFEDVDLCQRTQRAGGEVWRTPFFVVRHQGGTSHREKTIQKRVYYESQKRYFMKYRPVWETRLFSLLQRWILI